MDTILGGTGNDTINATAAGTLKAGDSIDGGAGTDTLNITMSAGSNNSLTGVTVKNVEVVNLTGANSLAVGTAAAATASTAAATASVAATSTLTASTNTQTVAVAKANAAGAVLALASPSADAGKTESSIVGASTANLASAKVQAAVAAAVELLDTATITSQAVTILAGRAAAAPGAETIAATALFTALKTTAFDQVQYEDALLAATVSAAGVAISGGTTQAERADVLLAAAVAVNQAVKATEKTLAVRAQEKAAADFVDTLAGAVVITNSQLADAQLAVKAGDGYDALSVALKATFDLAQYKAALVAATTSATGATTLVPETAKFTVASVAGVGSILTFVNVGGADFVFTATAVGASATAEAAAIVSAISAAITAETSTVNKLASASSNGAEVTLTFKPELGNATNATVTQSGPAGLAAAGAVTVTTVDGDLNVVVTRAGALASEADNLVTWMTAQGAYTLADLNTAAAAALKNAQGTSLVTNADDFTTIKARATDLDTAAGSVVTLTNDAVNKASVAATTASNAATLAANLAATEAAGTATFAATNFAGAEQIWLRAGSGGTNVTAVTSQTIGLATAMDNTVAFGATTSAASLYTLASTGAVALSGAALKTVNLTGTSTKGLALTNATVETLNVTTSGATVLNVAGLAALTTAASTGAGGVTVAGATNKVASITTGAGVDRVAINTATAKDNVLTPAVNETVNAVVSTGDGNDIVNVNTTGDGITTVNTGAGNDTIYVGGARSGVATIAAGEGNDTVFLTALLGSNPNLTIDGGAGTDTLVTAGGAPTAIDYLRFNAALSNFEAVRFTAAATIDASKLDIGSIGAFTFNTGENTITGVAGQTLTLAPAAAVSAITGVTTAIGSLTGATGLTATAAGYKAGVGLIATVYGGELSVAVSSGPTIALALKGSSATVGVTASGATNATTVSPTVNLTAAAGGAAVVNDLQSLTVNLASGRLTPTTTAVSTVAAVDPLATLNVNTIAANHLQALSSLKVNGTGAFTVNTGSILAADAKLTTIDVSGMNAMAQWSLQGVALTTFTNRSTTEITLNNSVAETVILGGAKDKVMTGSTVTAMDTIIGFQLTANATTATLVDLTKSDVLDFGTGAFVKFTTTATTLIGALTAAGDSALGANLAFHFGGDTYLYSDVGAGLDDADGLVKLVGLYDLDLLVLNSGNVTGVII